MLILFPLQVVLAHAKVVGMGNQMSSIFSVQEWAIHARLLG